MIALDDILRLASVPAWIFCIGCLAPAVARLATRRARYLDPIWLIVFLLALNRVSFLLRVSAEASHATSLILAIAMGLFARSYQEADHG